MKLGSTGLAKTLLSAKASSYYHLHWTPETRPLSHLWCWPDL